MLFVALCDIARIGRRLWDATHSFMLEGLHGLSWSAVRHAASSLGFNWVSQYDSDSICHQKRLPQQAPQHPDGREHRRFPAAAYLHDDDVARLLYREGQRR